jgi:hypothetical protein
MASGSLRYASLKDAFAHPAPQVQIKEEPEAVYKIDQEAPVAQEKFYSEDSEWGVECDVVQKHCSSCSSCSAALQPKKYGPIGTSLNELLNIVLIVLLIWILIFRPKL